MYCMIFSLYYMHFCFYIASALTATICLLSLFDSNPSWSSENFEKPDNYLVFFLMPRAWQVDLQWSWQRLA